MRFAVLVAAVALLGACESPPAFQVPQGPPQELALDVEFARWTMGRWALDEFDEELATQLAKYRIQVVDPRARPHLVARIDLGLPGNHQAIDVQVVRDGVAQRAGRVRVPDLSMTTLDAAAPLVAAVVARAVWMPGAPPQG